MQKHKVDKKDYTILQEMGQCSKNLTKEKADENKMCGKE